MNETRTLHSVIEFAKKQLRNTIKYEVQHGQKVDNIDDLIHEVADGAVPVYTTDVLDVVRSDITLAVTRSELAGDDSTPIQMMMINIYERVEEALVEYWDELEPTIEIVPHVSARALMMSGCGL